MPSIEQSSVHNLLLNRLPADAFELLATDLTLVDLPKKKILFHVGGPLDFCYFPDSGIGSTIAVTPEDMRAESGLFGFEGMAVPGAVLGARTAPHETVMQVAGAGYQIRTALLRKAMARSEPLRDRLQLYSHVMNVQTTYTSVSNAVHPIDERLARWLLMCDDRTPGSDMAVTHEFLSIMLAVRRPSVTTSLHVLEGNRFIYAERGYISVRDRAGLEEYARDAYGKPEAEYAALLGPITPSAPPV